MIDQLDELKGCNNTNISLIVSGYNTDPKFTSLAKGNYSALITAFIFYGRKN